MADEIIVMGDPRVAAVPVVECGEPLAPAGARFVRSGTRAADEPHRGVVRAGLLARLERAADELPDGLRLAWVEGYRRPELQERYFERYRAELRAADPALDDDTSYRLASRYVSPPAIARTSPASSPARDWSTTRPSGGTGPTATATGR